MHPLFSIVGIIFSDNDNYPKWSRKIKHIFIFNVISDWICEREIIDGVDSSTPTAPKEPTIDKVFSIWKNKDKKEYALIVAATSEYGSQHISSTNNSYDALNKLKYL